MRPPLSEREHQLIGDWLSEQFGLRFGPEKRDILRSRLEPRRVALGFDTFEQLYFHLRFHPDRKAEWQRLVPHLTNNESYFFREPGQLEVLRGEVLPELRRRLEEEGRREVRLLSAGCAAGEEPYTLSILVRESGLFPTPWRVRITGLDLDPQALARARAARYTSHAFRAVGESVRRRYFTPLGEEGVWELQPALREPVELREANLVDPSWAEGLPAQDVVFCRNVLIYFGERSAHRAIEGLHRALRPGGYLFLGHAESLSRVATPLLPERRPGAIFYRRPCD